MILAAALGELTLAKRDKVTFVCSPSLAAFPTWAEQLIAESTGKDRKGIVPVANERLSAPAKYGNDRLFVYLRFAGDENHDLDREIAALEAHGHPALRIDVNDKHDLGQEFFRWEFAVAGAGAALGIHPFNQPDVQLAKDLAKKAMENGARGGARIKNEIAANDLNALQGALSAWWAKKKARDYVAVQAFFQPSPDNTQELERLRAELQARLAAATSLGFGPRYLHSTGQLHKGGPNTVLVLQIVDQSTSNLAVPETNYTFDALIQAQSLGDYAALKQRRRRILRVNLGRDTVTGLRAVIAALQA
jgi:transaldolase/glucose-6-phosphate isomerase